MTLSTAITHIALEVGSSTIQGQGVSAEAALADARMGRAHDRKFNVFPISDRMAACYAADYNPTEAVIVDNVADICVPHEVAYHAERIAKGGNDDTPPAGSKITHIAIFAAADAVQSIQEVGSSAEAAIAAAVAATGAEAYVFVAKPVTPRMSALLAGNNTPTRWTEVDGVADLYDADYKPAFFVFSETGARDDEGNLILESLQDHDAIEAVEPKDAILKVIAGFDFPEWPGTTEYVTVEVPAGTLLTEALIEVGNDVYRLSEAFADAYVRTVEVTEDDWDLYIA